MAKKQKDNDNSPEDHSRFETSPENKKKAGQWFQRARELGDKRQYDYAVEYYVNGIEYWPDAVEEGLKPLHGCGVARHQSGGAKPGFKDTMKRSMTAKEPMQAFLNALWLFGHDPDNIGFIEGVLKNACRLRADDAGKWAAGVNKKSLENAAKPSSKQFQNFVEHIETIGDHAAARGETAFALEAYQLAMDGLQIWRRKIPKDHSVDNLLRDLSTKFTITKGKYQTGDSYRDSMSDGDSQMELHDRDRSVQADDRMDQLIASAKLTYDDDPTGAEAIKGYVDMLCRREREDEETMAIGVLVTAYKATDHYRWKLRADTIRMKQLNRQARLLAKAGDAEELKTHRERQLKYELGVFKERIETYPTDLRARYEYGVRLFRAGQFDDAIPVLQHARTEPKNRATCGLFLGRCFHRKKLYSQAITTFRETIEALEILDDEVGKELLYRLGVSCQEASQFQDAREAYGQILQMDYNFRDVRARLEGLPAE
jgi:tetratricopeptide (TPR) repeat protein